MDSRVFIESGALETYVMGLATEEEAKVVAEMAARYPDVKEELLAIEETMEKFDRLHAVDAPTKLKTEILSKIGRVPGSQFTVPGSGIGQSESKVIPLQLKRNNFFKYAAAVLLIMLVGSVVYIFMLRDAASTYRELASKYNQENDQLTRAMHASSDSIKSMQNDIALLKTPDMKSIELKGMDVAPEAKAMAYANTKTGEVYLEIMNLPAAPEGMQYQFWGIVDDKPVDAGMIPLEGDLSGIHPMTTVPNANAYAISLEPKGGSQQPTGKIFVMGNP